ncbi:phosphatase PAP2 family protein [Geodermatophilus sp. YIM 151500]|uniref:bifunctional phosphatase PAP2/diacylglycerol kinase family protein n=1 Tax=Geodermatophilus sp. YIM 151500 TaxID=2984531 RepID=UPI0021E3B6D1|nr:phosphatase PAP2 family protein [Geodermatophilus sp. YIM 151500]MCV2491107.1 phosphatase PAP2 family protein [Geodermatophilus sp. YIM 151500]
MRGRRLRLLDRRVHAWVGGLPTTPVDRWLRRLSTAADHGKLWLAVAVLLGLRRGGLRRGAVRGVGAQAVSSLLVNALLKRVFGRVRPDMANLRSERKLRRSPVTLSFPSGHSSSAAAFATGVAMEHPLAGTALAPVALGVGYSRVHVGVHYPGDVLAGLAVGAGVAVASRHWWRVRPEAPARVRTAASAPALPDGAGLVVAVNPRSGPDGFDPAEEVRNRLPAAEIREVGAGAGVLEVLDEAVRAGRARAVGVAGGDGSVAAAAAVALEHGLPLAVVPAGTLNHFARDVGVDDAAAVAEAVSRGEAVCVDVADVNGTAFLNTASIGVYPAMVRRRDELAGRLGTWVALTVAAAQVLGRSEPVRLEVAGRPVAVWILFVGNCRYTPRGLSPAWRPRLEDGLLDVQVLRADVPFSRTRAVVGALLGLSDRGTAYETFAAEEVRVVSRSGEQEVAYDGECGVTGSEFVFAKRRPLTVYCCRRG